MKHIASVSWGKDSTAMLLIIFEKNLPLDEIVFYDTGMEFKEIYDVQNQMLPLIQSKGIKYTILKPKIPMLDKMINYPHMSRDGKLKNGYGWCGGLCRWGTSEKITTINKYCKDAIQYIGIAYDEPKRWSKLPPNKIAPLVRYRLNESDCLSLCYANNINWGGLYEHLDRVSCWCCRNKNLHEIKMYKEHYPEYYQRLIELEEKIGEPMKKPKYLKDRFN